MLLRGRMQSLILKTQDELVRLHMHVHRGISSKDEDFVRGLSTAVLLSFATLLTLCSLTAATDPEARSIMHKTVLQVVSLSRCMEDRVLPKLDASVIVGLTFC